MTSQTGSVVLEAFFVRDDGGVVVVVAICAVVVVVVGVIKAVEVMVMKKRLMTLENSVRERKGLCRLDPSWSFGFSFWSFNSGGGGGGGGVAVCGGYVHG